MNFIKKMCVLRQIRPGFSGDGKQAGGVVKAEQYGKNLSVEVSVIGFAPLAAGESPTRKSARNCCRCAEKACSIYYRSWIFPKGSAR